MYGNALTTDNLCQIILFTLRIQKCNHVSIQYPLTFSCQHFHSLYDFIYLYKYHQYLFYQEILVIKLQVNINYVQIQQFCIREIIIILLQEKSKMATNVIKLQKKLQETHPGYAYQLLELQMAVEDDKLSSAPSISQITRLIQLYMVGVEVLESVADPRFIFFNNKIHSLMMKKHIVKKLHQSAGKNTKDLSMTAVNKAELQQKKNQHEINYYFNQGLVDVKRVKQMLTNAEKKQHQFEGKIKTDIKKQHEKLQERIKERKMRSEHGSVKKSKLSREKDIDSPCHTKDIRMEYFDFNYTTAKRGKGNRPFTSSVQKIIEKKYNANGLKYGSSTRPDPYDAI